SIAFVGYTPEIAASVMVLNPKEKQNVGGFGGGKAATVWRDAMAPVLEARGSGEFPPADEVVENGNTRPVPGCTSVRGCRTALADAGFEHRTVEVDSSRRSGTLLGTSPPRGGRAVAGQVVSILVSNGEDYVEPRPEPQREREPAREEEPESRPEPETPEPPAEAPAPDPEPEPAPEQGQEQQGPPQQQEGQEGQGRPDSGGRPD
ncbi:MAG TPA: penicillin-binding protein, partial [Geodermatophilus sp.]|nr:penicillin-binding protein [Geodermatophilus sp.]